MALVNITMEGGLGSVNKLLTRGRGDLKTQIFVLTLFIHGPLSKFPLIKIPLPKFN